MSHALVDIAPATLDDLGLPGCLYLAALLSAQTQRRPVAPTRRATLTAMHLLAQYRIIELPAAGASWENVPEAESTPIESIPWRYTWTSHLREGLLAALEEFLAAAPWDGAGRGLRVSAWRELNAAEAERFFEQQLAKHRFDAGWAQDLAYVHQQVVQPLSISQWRYAAWAAVRKGASSLLQHSLTAEALRETIYQELHRRAASISTGQWANCALPPYHPAPESALGRLVVHPFGVLGMDYWNQVPSVDGLRPQRTKQPWAAEGECA